jgi:hypothetical protein
MKGRILVWAAVLIMVCGALVVLAGTVAAMSPLDNSDAVLDPDGDGLTNVEEFNAGTDPGNPDTDNDGLPDGWEWDYQLDPTDPSDAANDEDYAGDEEYAAFTQVPGPHYTNYDEYYRFWYTEESVDYYQHTNPQNGNTDGDEFLDPDDPWPLNYKNDGVGGGGGGANQGGDAGSGPAEGGEGGDGDGDGNSDDDGDGLSDTAEAEMGTDPENSDTDCDGLSDDKEVEFGLDPNDWDTDNDMLRDGSELGLDQESTDGHFVDTDNDGL